MHSAKIHGPTARGLALCLLAIPLIMGLACRSSLAITLTDKMHSSISKGNRYYDEGEHDKALNEYRRALEQDSANAVPQFNAGDALYKMRNFQDGAQHFLKAASSSTDSVSAMSYYNLGNTVFNAGDLQSAVEAYKRSLLISPDDQDAKYNLEYALRMIKQQEQQQDQEQDQEQDQQQSDQQNRQDQQQSQEQKDQQQQDQQDQRQQEQQQPRQGQMTPEELKRILAAVEAADKQTQQDLLKQAARTKRLTEKDW
jgi:tetratricopeptide (TPR) repeat protein